MTTEQKIQKILNNADGCRWKIEQVLARVSDPEATLSAGVAEWLLKIGVEDERIEPALDEAIAPETRVNMFRGLMSKYHLNNQATAALLGCSVPTVASYRTGRLKIPVNRLILLQRIIEAIEAVDNIDNIE